MMVFDIVRHIFRTAFLYNTNLMQITILKPNEMAKELGVSILTLKKYYTKNMYGNNSKKKYYYYDPNFPVIRISKNVNRFVKERVLEYFERKKKCDCIPVRYTNTLLNVDLCTQRLYSYFPG